MSFSLKNVVPWGRSFDEYVTMFALTTRTSYPSDASIDTTACDKDLAKKIVGCGDGPASFNCTLTKRGGSVVSVDPIYKFTADDIARRITETYDTVMEQALQNRHEFLWQLQKGGNEMLRLRQPTPA